MSDKEVFIAMIVGVVSAIAGGLLIVPIQLLIGHVDGGDDLGWGFLWICLMIVSGITGFVFSARRAVRRRKEVGAQD
jgi:hypothetical protein